MTCFSVIMSGPKTDYKDAQNTTLKRFNYKILTKEKLTVGVPTLGKIIYHHYVKRSSNTNNLKT